MTCIYIPVILVALWLVYRVVEERWCWSCKKWSAKTEEDVTYLVSVPESARIGQDYFVAVRARTKTCCHCGHSESIGASSSICNKEDADIHRADMEIRGMSTVDSIPH